MVERAALAGQIFQGLQQGPKQILVNITTEVNADSCAECVQISWIGVQREDAQSEYFVSKRLSFSVLTSK
jgi:hypothetical protein